MMGRGRTQSHNNEHTRGSSLMYVVLLMTLLAVLSSGYMAISRYNMKAALNNSCLLYTSDAADEL